MLRFGILCLALCLSTAGVASVLDHFHLVVFGPCAGPGAAALYLTLLLTAGLGILFTFVGAGAKLIARLRQ